MQQLIKLRITVVTWSTEHLQHGLEQINLHRTTQMQFNPIISIKLYARIQKLLASLTIEAMNFQLHHAAAAVAVAVRFTCTVKEEKSLMISLLYG